MKFFCNDCGGWALLERVLFSSLLTLTYSGSKAVYAENAPIRENTHQEVIIKVRAIEATNRSETDSVDPESIADTNPRLADISKNLAHLEFSKFKLISEQEVKVQMMSKEVLTLGGGHSLTVRPLYVSSGRVGMWIHWADKDATLLDTRMHFACSDKVITGAESDMEGASAMILAVAAHLVKE
jgi:hypothetical protein